MGRPKNPNTTEATAATVRRGDLTAAARLRKHGWLVVAPEQKTDLPEDVLAQLLVLDAEDQLPTPPPPGQRPLKSAPAPPPASGY